jgi:hypothetical protein
MTHRKHTAKQMRITEGVFGYMPTTSRSGMMRAGEEEEEDLEQMNDSDAVNELRLLVRMIILGT